MAVYNAFRIFRINSLGERTLPRIEFVQDISDCIDDYITEWEEAPEYGTRNKYDSFIEGENNGNC